MYETARSRVSVVIPARNAGSELPECIDALRGGVAGLVPDEVVVVDDGSTDRTADVAASHGARVIRQEHHGPAVARNVGVRAASGEIVVFIDADCVPERGCLSALVAPFARADVVGVRGGYTTRQRSLIARFTQLELEEKQERLAASRCIAVMDTACAAYRRGVLLARGGFDERYPATSAEDVELSFRLVEQGARLVYAPTALVRHRHPERLGNYLWRKLRFGYYRALLYGRYPSRLRNDGYTPRLMPLQIAVAGAMVAGGALSPWLAEARALAMVATAVFGALSAPLAARVWPADAALAASVPPLLFARSVAQGLGLGAGFLTLIAHGAGARAGLQRRPEPARFNAGQTES